MHYRFITVDALLHRTKKIPTGCLEWTGSRDESGYGQIRHKGRTFIVTRLLMHLTCDFDLSTRNSRVFVCHYCDNPACINPEHLYLGTARSNNDDKIKRGRARNRVLNSSNVVQIFKCYAKGERPRDIAKQFGVCSDTVYSVLRRKTWAHVRIEK